MNWRKTELWTSVAFQVGALCSALAGALPPKWAAVLIGASNVAYAISRGLAKINQPPPH